MHAYLSAGSGKFDEAIGDLEELKNIAPDNAELLLQLGMFYVADKRTQQGIDIFSQILAEDSHSWMAHRARGDAYLNLGKQAEALADYEAALESQPGKFRHPQQPGLAAGHLPRRKTCATASEPSSWPPRPAN